MRKIFPKKLTDLFRSNQRQLEEKDLLIATQNERIVKLEERNDEWAREVREMRHENDTLHIIWPVRKKDIIKPTLKLKRNKALLNGSNKNGKLVISWVLPPMGPVSGGHTTIFRAIGGLEKNGFVCRVYIYDPTNTSSLEAIQENMKSYPKINAEMFYNVDTIDSCDGLFATSWHTAYPVYNSNAAVSKFYFIQDFEPLFDPAGTYSTLADNTYKFGLHGITLGAWMKKKLEAEYGMECDNFDLRVNEGEYSLTNLVRRKKIAFYARPVTPRRGFELGVLVLELFNKKHPEYEIHMFGWDVSRFDIKFDFVNHGIIDTQALNELYNGCAAGLVLSFTNMSLLPLEMMAAGCIPVVNRAEHTLDVGYSEYIQYAYPTPSDLADGLYEAIKQSEDIERRRKMAEYTQKFSWSDFNDDLATVITNKIRH